jgi:hypothetical protein
MAMTFRARSLTKATRSRALRWGAVAALLCAAPAPASAGGPDPAVDEASAVEAKELFQKARAAVKQGDLVQALFWFRKSHRRRPTSGTLLNMASCEEQLGLTASAWLHYRELIAQLPADDERLPLAKVRATALEPRVARLQIQLAPGAPLGTTVTQDNVELVRADLGAILPADPIEHVIVVTAPGRRERRYEVTSAEGNLEQVTVEPGPASASIPAAPTPAAPTPAAPSSGNQARLAGFIVGGVGIAGVGVSGVTGILAIVKKNEGTGKALATASTVAFAVGLSVLGVGTYLVLSNRDKPTSTAAFAPLVLPGGAGLGASGTF